MNFPSNFVQAFNETMKFEVGGFWNPNDPEVIEGCIVTNAQCKKVGYVNIPADRGGVTKFGIAQNRNKDVNVNSLTLNGAMTKYYTSYWLAGKCDKLPSSLAIMHFDGCVNIGVGRAAKFLQQAAEVIQDGDIGPVTLAKINSSDEKQLITTLSQARTSYYRSLVNADKKQAIFLNGWLRRINEVTASALSKFK